MHHPLWITFQRSLTLLVRYRSRGVFSLLSRCLRYSQGISNPCYSGADAFCTNLRYGVVTLFHAPFQETSRRCSRSESQSEHHIAREGFGLDCVAFTRGYYRYRGLLSVPADTEMFQFSAFPIAQSNCKEDSYSETPSSSPPCGSLGLFAAWHVRRRLSSRAIHQPAS